MSSFHELIEREVGHPDISTRQIAGAVVTAATREGPIVEKAYGRSSVEPDSPPLKEDATFWIASCTKLLTSIACLQCVERSLITLDEDVCRILPEWKNLDILNGFEDTSGEPILKKGKNTMTLRQLLTHSSGMGYDWLNPELMKLAAHRKNSSFAERSANYVLTFEPGEGWDYSAGIFWAGKVVERVNGDMALGDYFDKYILQPLDMQSTTFHLDRRPDIRARMPIMTIRKEGTGELVASRKPIWVDPDPDESGGAGLYSSVQDYMKVLTSLLKDDEKLLKKASVTEMFRPQLQDDKYIMALLDIPDYNRLLTGGLAGGFRVNYGIGGLLIQEEMPTGRKKGSMSWGGYPNLSWWIDREEGVCGLFASQIVPPGDAPSGRLFRKFEKSIYDANKKTQKPLESVL